MGVLSFFYIHVSIFSRPFLLLFREAIMEKVLKELDDNHPTLFRISRSFVLTVDVLDVFLKFFRSGDGVIPHLCAVGVDCVDRGVEEFGDLAAFGHTKSDHCQYSHLCRQSTFVLDVYLFAFLEHSVHLVRKIREYAQENLVKKSVE